MKSGNILCVCGERFYVETVFDSVICLGCGFKHDVSMFTEKVEIVDELLPIEDPVDEEELMEFVEEVSEV